MSSGAPEGTDRSAQAPWSGRAGCPKRGGWGRCPRARRTEEERPRAKKPMNRRKKPSMQKSHTQMKVRALVGAVISLKPRNQVTAGQPHSAAGTQNCGAGNQSALRCVLRSRVPAAPAVQIRRIDDDTCRAVIERLHHLALVEREPFAVGTVEPVAARGPCAFALFEIVAGAEQVRIVRHVEHRRVPQRPRLDFLSVRAVHEDR